MKLVIPTQELSYLINKVQNIISQKPSAPILGNFLIEAHHDELVLTATDLTISIRCGIEAQIEEEGSTTLPAKKLAQLVREITSPRIEISTSAHEVTTLIAGASQFKINGISKEGYPSWPTSEPTVSFSLPQSHFKDLIFRTAFAVSKEETRYILTGVHVQIAKGFITLTATDGKRLAKCRSQTHLDANVFAEAVLPIKAVDEILKNLTDEGEVTLSFTSDKIFIQSNDTQIATKLLSGDYPDISQIIPESPRFIFSLHREELSSLLRQVSLFLPDIHRSARFNFANGELKISANTNSVGEGLVSMPVNTPSENPIDIAFNPIYFLDILRHCKEETVLLGITDSCNPGIIVEGNQKDKKMCEAPLLFIIMPMRLLEEG